MCADDKDGRLRCVTLDGTEPEVQACVLIAQSHCPQQQVDRPLRQEELAQWGDKG